MHVHRIEQQCECGHAGDAHEVVVDVHAGHCSRKGCACIRFTWTDKPPPWATIHVYRVVAGDVRTWWAFTGDGQHVVRTDHRGTRRAAIGDVLRHADLTRDQVHVIRYLDHARPSEVAMAIADAQLNRERHHPLRSLFDGFDVIDRPDEWLVRCKHGHCARDWRLGKTDRIHPGNLLALLDHYAAHVTSTSQRT